MATERNRIETDELNTQFRYSVSGSAAMAPEPVPQRKKRHRVEKNSSGKREVIRVRQAEAIAPVAVIGAIVLIAMAMAVMYFRIQLYSVNNQVVAATSQLTALYEVEDQLEAQYEQLFDMQGIETDMINSGRMIKPSDSQQIYLEISEPDSATVYHDGSGIMGRLESVLSDLAGLFG